MKEKDKRLLKAETEIARVKGEFQGTLMGILYWDIPEELKAKLQKKINELESEKSDATITQEEAFKFAEWIAYFYCRSRFGEWLNLGFPTTHTTEELFQEYQKKTGKKE